MSNRRVFVTAGHQSSLIELLEKHLPAHPPPSDLIAAGAVWIEKKRMLDPRHTLDAGETARVFLAPRQRIAYPLPSEDLVFRDSRVLAVFKPAGLAVQPDPTGIRNNLTRGVADLLEKEGVSFSPSPVTRLDIPVSGLVLFGSSKKWERELFALVRERRVHKAYRALLSGNSPDRVTVEDSLIWDSGRARSDSSGRRAKTRFIRTGSRNGLLLYTVFLFTGRRHQIRCHAAEHLSPIVGDKRYGSPHPGKANAIALICAGYNFTLAGHHYRIRLSSDRIESILDPFTMGAHTKT